jgi:thiamine kinase-like enzyme
MGKDEFLTQLTFMERKVNEAIDALFKVVFPTAKQRRNLSVLRESFRQYLKAIEEVRKSVIKGVDRSKQFVKRLEKATQSADKFSKLMFTERLKSAEPS